MVDSPPDRTVSSSVMHDPQAESIATMYADSFLDAIAGAGSAGAIEEFGSFVHDVLERNPEFRQLLESGMISRNDKIPIIDKTIGPSGSPLFTNFLRVLARHERLDLLPLILKQLGLRNELRSGRQRVQVRSARPLSSDQTERVRQRLAATLPFEPILEIVHDPSLLGGLVIRVGDTVYDSSLRTRLNQLRGRLRERSLHEIQSGRDRFSHPA